LDPTALAVFLPIRQHVALGRTSGRSMALGSLFEIGASVDIRAAVVRKPGTSFVLESLRLGQPKPDEVLVRIVATGLCHTDLYIARGLHPPAAPAVLGHEGAGIVEAVGSRVSKLAVGDHVVLSFDSCGACAACHAGHPVFCAIYADLNVAGHRRDGSHTLESSTGPVAGCFLGQSSFATYALAHERNAIKVTKEAPLELLGPLGCSVQTGVGAVLNVLRPASGTSVAVFGCGAVGLSALMAAKLSGCAPIVAIDKVAGRRDLARALGATHTLDPLDHGHTAELERLGGAQYVVEASGVPAALQQALRTVRYGGVVAMLGGHPPDAQLTLNIQETFFGKTVVGIVEGDADPQVFIPKLVELLLAGMLPLERLVEFYPLDAINTAVEDSVSGRTVKPIIRMPTSK
jgi:aryl-alcohol dehydrogenase